MWNLRNKTNEQRKKKRQTKKQTLNIVTKQMVTERRVDRGMSEIGEGD